MSLGSKTTSLPTSTDPGIMSEKNNSAELSRDLVKAQREAKKAAKLAAKLKSKKKAQTADTPDSEDLIFGKKTNSCSITFGYH